MDCPIPRQHYKRGRKPRETATIKAQLENLKAEKWKAACEALRQCEQARPTPAPAPEA